MAVKVQLRGDTLAEWQSANPVLGPREISVCTDIVPPLLKIGDGVHTWTALPWATNNIASATINASGNLVLTWNDGSHTDCGHVVGSNGTNGADGATGAPGTPGQAATITIGTVTTGAAGSQALVTNTGTSSAAVLNFTIPQGMAGAGSGDMLKATYDTGSTSNANKVDVARLAENVAATATVWTQKWYPNGFIMSKPADAYASPYLPIPRNATISAFVFWVQGTPIAATTITIKLNGTAIGQTASLSAAGKTTLTLSTALTVSSGDTITYTVGGAGLSACYVTAVPEGVNR